jgi:hypothetical protein
MRRISSGEWSVKSMRVDFLLLCEARVVNLGAICRLIDAYV